MRDLKNKSTIFIIVALVVVCGGSFLGVRALNKNAIKAETSMQSYQSSESSTTVSTTASTFVNTTSPTVSNLAMPTSVTAEATTNNIFSAATSASTTSGVQNQITTYPMASTTKPNTTTTTVPTTVTTTTQPTSNPYQTNTEPSKVIENAAIFDNGFLSYQFNPGGKFYYTNDDPWQRNFGFNSFYDMAAPFTVMYYDTMRCRFEYGGKDWMIQFWKGQYGWVFIGHEIGVYTKPKDRTVMHYDCASDEDALYMSMTGYRKGEEIFSREYGKYWWCTGFVPGKLDNFSDRSELSISCRITCKDETMLKAFCASLDANGMVNGQNYTVNGLDVFIKW